MSSRDRPMVATAPRAIVCAGCGSDFSCDVSGACWCMDEAFRLPMPVEGASGDCLCPTCLRALASSANART